MQVTRLRVYPVKSFAGLEVGSTEVLPWGLADDRRWAVIDPDGEPVTAREANALLSLGAVVLDDGALLLSGGDAESLRVPVPTGRGAGSGGAFPPGLRRCRPIQVPPPG